MDGSKRGASQSTRLLRTLRPTALHSTPPSSLRNDPSFNVSIHLVPFFKLQASPLARIVHVPSDSDIHVSTPFPSLMSSFVDICHSSHLGSRLVLATPTQRSQPTLRGSSPWLSSSTPASMLPRASSRTYRGQAPPYSRTRMRPSVPQCTAVRMPPVSRKLSLNDASRHTPRCH